MKALGRFLTHPIFLRAVGLVVGAVLVLASLDKIAHPDRFADIVHDYDMLPLTLVNAFALALPMVEFVTGAALLVGVWRRAAGLLATGLTAMFMLAIAQALLRGLDIECGCFDVSGMSSTKAGWDLFARDAGLLVAAGWMWRRG